MIQVGPPSISVSAMLSIGSYMYQVMNSGTHRVRPRSEPSAERFIYSLLQHCTRMERGRRGSGLTSCVIGTLAKPRVNARGGWVPVPRDVDMEVSSFPRKAKMEVSSCSKQRLLGAACL